MSQIREIAPDRVLIKELSVALRQRVRDSDDSLTDYEKQLLMRAGMLETGRWIDED